MKSSAAGSRLSESRQAEANANAHPDSPAQEGSIANRLFALIKERQATVGVVGLGYVGLPLVHAFYKAGLKTLGFDVDPRKITALKAGKSYLKHIGDSVVGELAASDTFEATGGLERLSEADAILVCVPTPLGAHREPDLSYVVSTGEAIGSALRPGQLLVLESTTYPGTTRDEFLPAVLRAAEQQGRQLVPGQDFFVAYSPEREDPGRQTHSTATTPKVVGGLDSTSTILAAELYRSCVDDVRSVSTAEVAEASKLLENIFRSVNIALVNELKMLLAEMNIDVWEVVEAAASKPFGFMPFYPGPGLGGHCIPIDPFYLSWKAKEIGRPTRFVELAGEINATMPEYVIGCLLRALNSVGKAVKNARVLVLGLAYKADVDDTRESPSFELIERLNVLGAMVDYSDPHIPQTIPVRKYDLGLKSVELTAESLHSYDVVLLATAHSDFDYGLIARHAQLVVDTRNALRDYSADLGERLFRA